MKFVDHLKQRTPYERVAHAVLYELVGIITSMPIIAFFSGKSFSESGLIALIVSITAMTWNYIFNLIFDKVKHKYQFNHTPLTRVIHGILFEVGLIGLTVPLIALIMGLTLLDAFLLELAMLIYFFPYTIVFNWGYDKIKERLIKHYD